MIKSRVLPNHYICLDNGEWHGWVFIKDCNDMFVSVRKASRIELLDAIEVGVDEIADEIAMHASRPNHGWFKVSDALPENEGEYKCSIERGGEVIQGSRLFKKTASGGLWFGGCRPFADNDKVTHWFKPAP